MKEEEAFLKENWESQPLVVRANQERKDLFPALSSLGFLKNLLKSRAPFQVSNGQSIAMWIVAVHFSWRKDITDPSIST